MTDLARYSQLRRSLAEQRPLQEAVTLLEELRRLEQAALQMGLLYTSDGHGGYTLTRLPLHKWITYLRLSNEHDLGYIRLIEAEITVLLASIEESALRQVPLIKDAQSCDEGA